MTTNESATRTTALPLLGGKTAVIHGAARARAVTGTFINVVCGSRCG